jgi:hypothetical protein
MAHYSEYTTEVEIRCGYFPITIQYDYDSEYDNYEKRRYVNVDFGDFYCGDNKRKLSKRLRNEILKQYEDILIEEISNKEE